MADIDTGMERGDMRKLLVASKRQPVNCGLGMGKEGTLLLLDKIKPPRMLTKDLEKKFPDMKQPHWGTAVVDMDVDPKLVILTLNKAAPGMARRLKKTLKGTGFSKVEIRLEDGSVADQAVEEEEEDSPPPAAHPFQRAAAADQAHRGSEVPTQPDDEAAPPLPAQAASAAPGASHDAGTAAQTAAPPDAPAPPPSAVAQAHPAAEPAKADADTGALTKQLAGLVREIIQVAAEAPASAAALKQQAVAAQAAIKAHDLAAAIAEIAELQAALEEAAKAPHAEPHGKGGPQAPDAKKRATLATARRAWAAARGKVAGDLEKLHQSMQAAYQDHAFGDQLDNLFETKVRPVLTALDERLAHKLDELTSNQDPPQHAKLLAEARQILDGYSSYVASEPLIAKLDQNPFVKLQIGAILSATLSALEKAVQ
jgi:hypothetical protein